MELRKEGTVHGAGFPFLSVFFGFWLLAFGSEHQRSYIIIHTGNTEQFWMMIISEGGNDLRLIGLQDMPHNLGEPALA